MKKFRILRLITLSGFLLISISPLSSIGLAESLYLENGEVIKGKLVKITDSHITLESELGYGRIDIPRDEILSINFPDSTRLDLARRYGIGYHNKTPSASSSDRHNYQVNQISFRTYTTNDFFIDYLIGFNSYEFFDPNTKEEDDYSVFQGDIRCSYVFARHSNAAIYLGGSFGALSINDKQYGLKETGATIAFYTGVELFLSSLPDFGFSGELSVTHQNMKSLKRNDITVTALPTLAVHFYF